MARKSQAKNQGEPANGERGFNGGRLMVRVPAFMLIALCSPRARKTVTDTRRSRPSRAKERTERDCAHCQTSFAPKRGDAKFCSSACRVKQHRQLLRGDGAAASLARWVSREMRGINQHRAISAGTGKP